METVIVKFEWYNELLKKLEDFFPNSQKLSGELRCAMERKWKNMHGFICLVDSWPKFTTVIWKPDSTDNRLEFMKNHHVIVTKSKEQFKKMLQTPGVINWKSCCRFAVINERLFKIMKEVSEENGGKFTAHWSFSPLQPILQFALEVYDSWLWNRSVLVGENHSPSSISDIDCERSVPEGFSLKPLTKADVDMVVTNWNYVDDGLLEYTTALIKSFTSVALYNQGQQLVGYMLEYNNEEIGFLHLFEEFRGQGYSKVIVSSLAKKLLENGRKVYVCIYSNNTVSRNLHKSLGFHEHPEIYSWLMVHDPCN
ncbi:hypothetical protein LOTGIDRAFT_152512 [Lottia gigantea]|uniref:Glycine N-acyltransferase-like protein n=1 Tax=Lottia gigantea TaxID=225164 RepID=V4BI79_LOTGI|nr:hypothetical protein LOTGIDRAFT_152512 [Lottia gigantea]ESP05647.1 hypothetical protein LOTGIDRAFT_152512 [Lottia gigantea]